ncbi:CDP-diacylglycerol--serine O-phosphatidyltransferase [Flavobacteriaceae bacterium UJ101]|nr:CDP-diacylglycerol--serine O-phosphatidyltransferase [Flavobacteriaceae bacterium UJ101]
MRKHIPNIITLANLFCGCLAILVLGYAILVKVENFFSLGGEYNDIDLKFLFEIITLLIFSSLLFDFADGLVARLLNVKSELGAQLDSLADMVTFGVFPGFLMIFLIPIELNSKGDFNYFILLGLLITLFSALRLAKFNIDETQTENFKGLAVPANTLFILSLALVKIFVPESFLTPLINHIGFLMIITLLSCYLLVSNIPMFSFKMKNFNFSENIHRYLLLIISIILLVIFQLVALPLIIVLYILLSIIFKKKFT